jgi:HAD superfamily hydrolase (TIGR01549 family)
MLNAVLFDLDNTLVARDEAFRQVVETAFSSAEVRGEVLRLDDRGRGNREELFRLWSQHASEALTQIRLGVLIAERLKPDADLVEALRKLSATVKLGVISNGSGETQRKKFHAAGLDEVFCPERFWISDEIGAAKPEPAIFWHASRAIQEDPANCLYIGDDEARDGTGAASAGMRFRLVREVLTKEHLEMVIEREVGK